MSYKWPTGKHPAKVRAQVASVAQEVLTGRVLAIDPSSGGTSLPGWAEYRSGELVGSGTIPLDQSQPIHVRLAQLAKYVEDTWNPSVLAIEEIRGRMAHVYLTWSVGATIAGACSSHLVEVPQSFWKVVVPEDYEKGDEADAIYIGKALIELAREIVNE